MGDFQLQCLIPLGHITIAVMVELSSASILTAVGTWLQSWDSNPDKK
jgi:hypothetical protein